ncbi:MAG: peptide chain release factor N(5)-glutamine methyltransferase [Actinobacteria bacterium]|nr:peptide chain release factor N(5)-glutamine methyltransferase [Actinomycetota bacterium]
MSRVTRSVLVDIELRLKNANVPSPRFDAESLVAFVLKTSRNRVGLIAEITDEQYREIEKLVEKRVRRIPLQHLIGEQGFRYLVLNVGPGVFIPRPETELLVESVIRYIKDKNQEKVLVVDYCAGSGSIALSIAKECSNVEVFAIEKSLKAFKYLEANYLKYENEIKSQNSKVHLINADVNSEVIEINNLEDQFDVVVSNPPYIPEKMVPKEIEVKDHDPAIALYGGKDGLEIVRVVVEKATKLLKTGGLLAIEHSDLQGNLDDELSVPYLLKSSNCFEKIEDRKDLNALPRYCVGFKK